MFFPDGPITFITKEVSSLLSLLFSCIQKQNGLGKNSDAETTVTQRWTLLTAENDEAKRERFTVSILLYFSCKLLKWKIR